MENKQGAATVTHLEGAQEQIAEAYHYWINRDGYTDTIQRRKAFENGFAAASECAAQILTRMLPENNRNEQHLRPDFQTCEDARTFVRSFTSGSFRPLSREQQITAMAMVLDECRWFKAPETGIEVKSFVWATRLWEAANPPPDTKLRGTQE